MSGLHKDALRAGKKVVLVRTFLCKLCSEALHHGVLWWRPGGAIFTQPLDFKWIGAVHNPGVDV